MILVKPPCVYNLTMPWTSSELEQLSPILQQILLDLPDWPSAHILVLCSGRGETTFWLADHLPGAQFTGLELDRGCLEAAILQSGRRETERIHFYESEFSHVPFPDASFDAVVSESILHPTPAATRISHAEMARVLRPGGRLLLTDLLLSRPIPHLLRNELHAIGINYLSEASLDELRCWLGDAGLVDLFATDLTHLFQRIWRSRRAADIYLRGGIGYSLLFDDPAYCLGCGIHYVYLHGVKS